MQDLKAKILDAVPYLIAVERTVLMIAAVVALFPLLQYYQEADARRLDRVFGLISVGNTCEYIQDQAERDFGASSRQSPLDRRQGETFFENGINMRKLHELCVEVGKAITTDELLDDTLKRLEALPDTFSFDSASD